MKILTLTQPWATLVALEEKRIETRSWHTNYRGPIAIHAAQGLGSIGGVAGLKRLCQSEPFRSVLQRRCYDIAPMQGAIVERTMVTIDPAFVLPRGVIVAVADLVECEVISALRITQRGWLYADGSRWPLTDQERAFGDYSPGRYAWLLSNIRPLRAPLPYRGAQSLRDVPPGVAARIEEAA